MRPGIYERSFNSGGRTWNRTTIRALVAPDGSESAGEKFLEAAIAERPELIGFGTDDDVTSVRGPFVCYRQVSLTALNGRTVSPDLIILCGNGDVVVVEVKLGDNPELRDRRVIAQVLEYAASLGKASETDLVRMFRPDGVKAEAWHEVVAHVFGTAPSESRWLASQFLARFKKLAIHLVIACDEVPRGVRELVAGVVGQHALGDYDFRVVEIEAYAVSGGTSVMLVPAQRVQSEIVARTAVTVDITGGGEGPVVQVEVTSLEDVEAAVSEAKGRGAARPWDEETFFAKVGELPAETRDAMRRAYDHFRTHAYDVTFGSGAKLGTVRVHAAGKEIAQLATDGLFWVFFGTPGIQQSLSKKGIEVIEGQYRSLRPAVWVSKLGELLAALDECVGRGGAV